LAKARDSLERSIKLDPADSKYWLELSDLCKSMGDYQGARYNLIRVLNFDSTSIAALTKLAVLYEFNFHDYQKAIDEYQHILSIDPDSVTALVGIDRCKQKSGDLAGIMKDSLWRMLRGVSL
jgi:tetratricopeptide (TPR) repeat protein